MQFCMAISIDYTVYNFQVNRSPPPPAPVPALEPETPNPPPLRLLLPDLFPLLLLTLLLLPECASCNAVMPQWLRCNLFTPLQPSNVLTTFAIPAAAARCSAEKPGNK